MAVREIGKGHSAIETLCGFMNITPPMNNNSYTEAMKELYLSYRKKAIDNMESVATSVRKEKLGKEYSSDTIVNVDASFDGTWQRRGFSSMNGVVFVILKDSGQCVDYHVMSKKCSACEVWKGRECTVEHERFLCDHDCSINHAGSAGSMEIAGVLQCFKQSVHLHNLRYTNYIGDSDSKSYLEVVKADPYNGVPITKLECIGHVQKRVGSRLRTLKKECKDKIIVNGKSVALLQKLTLKRINTLQNYYGIAIRQSCKTKDISVMQKAIGAILYHSSESNNPDYWYRFLV